MSTWRKIPFVALYGYLFFLAIELLGRGMKASFAETVRAFLEVHGDRFTELVSFVMGILGTALLQSSSSVTSMSVVLVQEGIMPLVIAAGIVHGANLGTSVTSSFVAFASEAPPLTGRPLRDLRSLLTAPRGDGFRRAVGTAVVHDMFNIVMVTLILLVLELPFGVVLHTSDVLAGWLAGWLAGSDVLLDVISVVSPSTWTRPISEGLLGVGVPGWVLLLAGVPLLFTALRGFSARMRDLLLADVDPKDAESVGARMLGTNPFDTFLRGLVVTILVQSSSATTSMVVPLAAMGLFQVRAIFPFILGANIGTTTTALLAASGGLGQPGFHEGMTIAVAHLLLNTLAVVLAVGIPGLQGRILAAAGWLADRAEAWPAALLVYLCVLVLVVPALAYFLPTAAAAVLIGALLLVLLVGPAVAEAREARTQ